MLERFAKSSPPRPCRPALLLCRFASIAVEAALLSNSIAFLLSDDDADDADDDDDDDVDDDLTTTTRLAGGGNTWRF